jgi:MoxR-like ATPase
MTSQSERFEREAEETRWQLAGTLEELRDRMTPGRVVDQVVGYTRDGPAAEFLRNLGREVRENPMPLVLIGIGIAWLMLATSRTSRAAIASAADSVAKAANDIGTATSAAVHRTSEWGQQTATRLSDRANIAASAVSDKAAELAGRASEVSDGVVEKARAASAMAREPRSRKPNSRSPMLPSATGALLRAL